MSKRHSLGEIPWFKSSFSRDAASCVEVRFTPGTALIRDSKYLRNPANPPAAQPIIAIPVASWNAFLSLATGHPTTAPGLPALTVHPDGGATLRSPDGTTLTYTPAEWTAYVSGIHAGEFAAA
ncbi:DUF397 domain-containing protein [Nocardia sp. NEAU-G5]|uniref:DUF397 domain-containing protein n=1 Tax=Nocardia albiluteola TaxID=2842303 RepID=A0ABS6B053_9NOCA|nr:DUF397 domain-containing protein [Nocardia albiluteola]MBU3062846.1 DUF397 domain-containing protein [Nocardia albiluteola]